MTIKQNKIHTIFFAVITLAMLLLLFYGAISDLRSVEGFNRILLRYGFTYSQVKVMCIVGCIFFCFGEIYFAKEIFSKKLLIEICDEYFYDNSSAISLGKIAWSDMEIAYMKDGFLNIILKNPEAYIAKIGRFQKQLIQANFKLGYGNVCISTIRFKKSAPKFIKEFSKRMTIENL